VGRSVIDCQVLEGVAEGFRGFLTTASASVGGLRSLRKRRAYLYGVGSIAIGFSLIIVIVGALQWTSGVQPPACKA
jgi:CrcB protein